MGGLFISAASLFILQSGMGGLQDKLMVRSKNVLGHAIIRFHKKEASFVYKVLKELRTKWPQVHFLPEYEIELLLRNKFCRSYPVLKIELCLNISVAGAIPF